MPEIEKIPICGICGTKMVEKNGEFKCKTCKYFFGESSKLKKCKQCTAKYGYYPAVERKIRNIDGILTTSKDKNDIPPLCPECRRKYTYPLGEYSNIRGSFTEMIGAALAKGDITPSGLEYHLQGLTTKVKEFVDYCQGRMKIYFEK